ncbi:hypothetical protein NKH18_48180 [Streptomyces sp. M10(2022)]
MKPSRRTFKPLLLTAAVVSTAAVGVSFLSMTSQAQTPPEHAVDASQLTAASRLQAARCRPPARKRSSRPRRSSPPPATPFPTNRGTPP